MTNPASKVIAFTECVENRFIRPDDAGLKRWSALRFGIYTPWDNLRACPFDEIFALCTSSIDARKRFCLIKAMTRRYRDRATVISSPILLAGIDDYRLLLIRDY